MWRDKISMKRGGDALQTHRPPISAPPLRSAGFTCRLESFSFVPLSRNLSNPQFSCHYTHQTTSTPCRLNQLTRCNTSTWGNPVSRWVTPRVMHTRQSKCLRDVYNLLSQVSRIILGCMSYGSGGEWMISDHDEAIKQIKYAYDQGINVSRAKTSPWPSSRSISHIPLYPQ